jgi:hypothetical protein
VRCHAGAGLAAARITRRAQDNPRRHAHPGPRDQAGREAAHRAFRPLRIDAPALDVDTEDGYRPPFGQILSFIGQDLYRTSEVFAPRPRLPLFWIRPSRGAPAVDRDDRPGDKAGPAG